MSNVLPERAARLKMIQKRYPVWSNITEAEWYSWQWQMRNSIRTVDQLGALMELGRSEISAVSRVERDYHFSITPYYFSLIDTDDNHDPVRLQSVPDEREIAPGQAECSHDPLGEHKDMPVAGLVHRYPDRCLAIVTNICSTYCRHCTRKRLWCMGEAETGKAEIRLMFEYVAKTKSIREVVISGGDPLVMGVDRLDWILNGFSSIPHVEVVRIGSRVPVVLPMRITGELCAVLKRYKPLWFNTQFNHANEVTPESAEACFKLQDCGIPVSNQTVLLRGVNDTVSAMTRLLHALQKIMVRPYYLFQCDLVTGTDHFRTDVRTGINIIEKLRGHTSGLAIPQYVIDAPGGMGKIPLQPRYLLSFSENELILKNYEGRIFSYPNPVLSINTSNDS